MEIELRPAIAADRAVILAMVPELVAFGPPPWRNAQRMTRTDLAVIDEALAKLDDQEHIAIYVATLDGDVVGFVHVRAVVDYYLQSSQAHVADLVVSPRARGRGIASKLLREAERWAKSREFSQLTIAVFDANLEALELYERRGFERETIRLIKPLRSGDP